MLELIDKLRLRENSKKALWLNIGLIAAISMFILLLFFYIYLPVTTHHGDTITVPDLSNMKVSELEAFLDDKELRFIVDDSSYEKDKAPLSVLKQDPIAGSKVKINRRIHLTINSSTPPLEKIPDVIDISLKQAVQMLESAGFKVGENKKYVPDVAKDVIIRVSCEGRYFTHDELKKGTLLAKGSVIEVEIGDGLGNNSFKMPNVVGMTVENAEGILSGSNLTVNIEYDNTATEPAGTVIRQKPDNISMVKPGTVVDIWVAGEKK
jgi:beta-lactam-binding protein with PASTA domain